jgi:hypothetical protein
VGVARNLPLAAFCLTEGLQLAPRWRPDNNGLRRETPRGARERERAGRRQADEARACPLSTGEKTRRIRLVRGKGRDVSS